MKIDKTNVAHWLYLIAFAINVIVALILRALRRRPGGVSTVVLYGHKLSGNLLAIQRYLQTTASPAMRVRFLTMDPSCHRELARACVPSVLAIAPACARLLADADAVISDHGLHVMKFLLGRSTVKFFDVWHGIPFKGFDADDFRLQHRYQETWVTSPLLAKLYVDRFGFAADKVKVTGYARTDVLVRHDQDVAVIKRNLGLDDPDTGKIVLFAPTWKQDAQQRSIFPFGVDEKTFLQRLSQLAQREGATFVMRAHLNSGKGFGATYKRIEQRPFAQFPDTEALLLASDILVCDWSSIAFDYLLLDRPTVFLDVPAPFAKGFSLGPEYRFGDIVADMDALLETLQTHLRDPATYQARHGQKAAQIRQAVYADNADGHAAARCVARLRLHLL